jgi:hypothetical protein
MNTKGIKFLAVLAIMVMAFAAIVALAPADKDVTAIPVYGNDAVVVDPTVIDSTVTASLFYISDDAIVKIKDIKADSLTFYVQNGAELELDFKKAAATTSYTPNVSKPITIYTVTGDQQRITTSYINDADHENPGLVNEGKIVIDATKFQFKGADKQNVVYTAMMPSVVETYTTSTSGPSVIITDVTTGKENYAYVSASDVVLDADSGSLVAVAAGQSIDTATKDLTTGKLVYGVAVKEDSMYTYYAVGMNAGSVTLNDSNDSVIVNNGSVIVNNGTATVKATAAKGVKFDYTAANQIDVSKKLTAGTMSVSGKVKFASGFDNQAVITFNASADVVSGSEMKVTGTLILKNDKDKILGLNVSGDGFIVAQNEKLWTYTDGTVASLKFASGSAFKGQYDVTEINKNADVEDAFSTATIMNNQTFRMVGDTIVANQLTIEGVLIIEPGVTLTITQTNNYGASVLVEGQYAQIINNGTIIIKTTQPYTTGGIVGLKVTGGTVLNYGTINASSPSTVTPSTATTNTKTFVVEYGTDPMGYGVVNDGSISIGKYDTASLDKKFTNQGTVTVTGTLMANSFVNGGQFTLSNAKVLTDTSVAGFTVTMSKGAVFNLVSAEVEQGKIIKIQNALNTSGVPANYIQVTAATPATTSSTDTSDPVRITGLTVTDTSTSKVKKLDVSGSIGTSIPTSFGTAENELELKGNIDVTSKLTINKGYKLDFAATTELNVSGEMVITKDVTATATLSNALMVVTGDVSDLSQKLNGVSYVGAMYETTAPATFYTTLEDAITAAALAEIPQVNVGGEKDGKFVTVTDDLIIPKGLTVDGHFLVVDEKASIVVEEDARFSFTQIIIIDGMIAAADVNSIDYETILADVKEEDDESTAAVCMSLQVALMLATAGDVIELDNTFFAADEELIIPEGVTVDATAVNGTEFVLVNSDLIVNGNLIVDQFAFIATTDDTIGITVNGFIYDKCSDGACFVPWWYNPFGVSYLLTDDEDNTWFVLTTIDNIQPSIDVADDARVTVHGDAKLDELTVSGRDDMPGEVIFTGDVEIGVINIDEVTLKFADGTEIDTTVRNSVGSITITGAYVDKYLSIYDMAIYSSVDEGVYMEGVVTDNVFGTYGILFEGITGMDGTDTKTAINYGKYEEDAPTIVFAGETTVIGKKVYINDNEELLQPVGMTTVNGTLYVANNSKLTINGEVQVLGALMAADRSEEGNAGAIDANGNVYIGMLESDIYYLGSAAIFSGEKINLAQGYFIFVAPAAIIDPQIVADLDTMGVYVDDELWFTMYGYETDKYELTGLAVPMTNARLAVVLDENGDVVYCHTLVGTTNVLVQDSAKRTLSGYGNVYIVLNYDIFDVKIKTDGSVKAVYIDGILMETGNVANIFTMEKVAAGTHKVTVEAATGYDADKCVLYTELGTILPGMAFTFTEYDCTEWLADGTPVVVYNINGTEIQPEPVPPTPEEESQWTVTTILLVILVVLIAIMAVIVALRLNRS